MVERWRCDLLAPPPYRWWIAERRGRPVGFAGIGVSRDRIDARLGELDTIAIDPSAWRSGVGRALMSKALHALRTDGYHEAILWTLADYPGGDAFYRSTGWHPDGAVRQEGRQIRYRHPLALASRSA